ncbi:MAG: hypothetical protein ACREO5_09320 [Candidatus Binatia bacterium]
MNLGFGNVVFLAGGRYESSRFIFLKVIVLTVILFVCFAVAGTALGHRSNQFGAMIDKSHQIRPKEF